MSILASQDKPKSSLQVGNIGVQAVLDQYLVLLQDLLNILLDILYNLHCIQLPCVNSSSSE